MINTLSMFKYKIDEERENEVLWGDKKGFAERQRQNLSKLPMNNTAGITMTIGKQ